MKPQIIINTVCDYFKIEQKEANYKSYSRDTDYLLVRYYCYLFLKQNTLLSLTKIGSFFGQNHATVINALKKIKNWIETDDLKRTVYEEISYRIKQVQQPIKKSSILMTKIKFRRLKNPALRVI